MNCRYCKSPLELDTHVLDNYKWWCKNCNACFNDAGRPQPGMEIWFRIPHDNPDAHPDEQVIKDAVVEAAVRIFTPSDFGLMFMPSATAKQDLKAAVRQLLKNGWQSSKGDNKGT